VSKNIVLQIVSAKNPLKGKKTDFINSEVFEYNQKNKARVARICQVYKQSDTLKCVVQIVETINPESINKWNKNDRKRNGGNTRKVARHTR
jgi:hypothetical protein